MWTDKACSNKIGKFENGAIKLNIFYHNSLKYQMPLRQTRRSITNYIKIQINFNLIKTLNLEFKPLFLFSPLLHLKYDQSKIRIILKRKTDQNFRIYYRSQFRILFFLKFDLRVQVLSSCIKGAHPHWIRAYSAFSNLIFQSIFIVYC